METFKIACYVAGTVMFFASFGLLVGGLANIIKRQLRKGENKMKSINEFIQDEFNGDACEFYRALVDWMNYRAEFMNQGKGFTRLAKEYIQFYLEH